MVPPAVPRLLYAIRESHCGRWRVAHNIQVGRARRIRAYGPIYSVPYTMVHRRGARLPSIGRPRLHHKPKSVRHAAYANAEFLHARSGARARTLVEQGRSEEHTSELQYLMRISYAVFGLKKKKQK